MADTAAHLVDRVPSLGFGSAITQEDLRAWIPFGGQTLLSRSCNSTHDNATGVLCFGHCKRRRSRRPSPV
jgi:hypothetical protein